ncbi:hypothetical protein M9X92_010741 [Pyricularia oryzae]|nr:hypothetical protein M9X92_010741 [Pyricularia oryzae]
MSTHHHCNPTNCINRTPFCLSKVVDTSHMGATKRRSHLFKLVPVSVENIVFPWGCTTKSPTSLPVFFFFFFARR